MKCEMCGEPAYLKDPDRCRKHRRFNHRKPCGCACRKEYVDAECRSCDGKPKDSSFLRYLMRGRTEKQLYSKFGEEFKGLLKRSYPGYSLFKQRNHYNEKVYVLLPKIKDDIEIKSREWSYHIGRDDEGVPDPYIVAQLPRFKDRVIVAPLFDVHLGHRACREDKLRSYLRWIEETDNVYAILGGDLMENALDDGRGMSYDQTDNPESQIQKATKLLAPIAHKILCATRGNHEARTVKRAGVDPLRYICSRLDIPYFTGPVFLSLLANEYKWTFYVFHGKGNSQTKGGKLNAAQRAASFTGMINFYLSGHVHDPLINSEVCIVEDPINCRLMYMSTWTVIAQSFLAWKGTYAYDSGYRPPGKGGTAIELFEDGDYRATLK